MLDNEYFKRLISGLQIPDDNLKDTEQRLEYNELIGEYYNELYENYGNTKNKKYEEISKNVLNCNKDWFFDKYNSLKVLDLTHVNLCHNRFCPNCQKLLQASRLFRFTKPIAEVAKDCYLFHLILTIPNMQAKLLKKSIITMNNAFSRLISYIIGYRRIKGMDLKILGFHAAVRSLEITYKQDIFHPHFHCIIAFKKEFVDKNKDYILKEKNINDYSFSFGVLETVFSDLEITIQKLWKLIYDRTMERNEKQLVLDKKAKKFEKYLLDNNIQEIGPHESVKSGFKTVKEAIKGSKKQVVKAQYISLKDVETLKLGYSCQMKQIEEDNYFEVFKYVSKMIDEDSNIMTVEQFETLYFAMKDKRTFQSYGAWRNIPDGIDMSVSELYKLFQIYLSEEEPETTSLKIADARTLSKEEGYIIISKRNIQKQLELLNEYRENEDYAALHEALENIKKAKEARERKYGYSYKTITKTHPRLIKEDNKLPY